MKYKLELALFGSLVALAAILGSWQGQYIAALNFNPDKNNSVLLIGATFVWVALAIILKRDLRFNFPYKAIFFLLALDLLTICFFRDDIVKSVRNFFSIILTYGIIFFLSSLIQSIKFKRSIFIVNLVILLVIIASAYVHQTKVGPLMFFVHDDPLLRLGGLFNYGQIGLLAGFNIILSLLSLSWGKPSLTEYFYHIAQMAAMVVVIALTDTRSALISAVIAASAIVYLQIKKSNRHLPVAISIGAVIFLSYFAYSTYVAKTTGELTLKESFEHRVGIWRISLDGIKQNPLAGFGSASYLAQSMEAASFNAGLSDPHSAMLGLALQSGVPAVLLFLILYVKISARALRGNFVAIAAIIIYWLISPFFWGDTYLQTIGFVQIIFGVSFIGILLHSDLYAKEKIEPT